MTPYTRSMQASGCYGAQGARRAAKRGQPGLPASRERLFRRGMLLTLGTVACILMSLPASTGHFAWMLLAFVLCAAALVDFSRSLRVRWDLYHGGVVFMLYTDMMILTLIAVLTVWPYPGR